MGRVRWLRAVAAIWAIFSLFGWGRPPATAAAAWRPAGLTEATVQDVVVDHASGGWLYSIARAGPTGRGYLYRSVDGGRSWLTLDRGFPSGFVPHTVSVSPSDGRIVLVAGTGGLYRSSSSGATWSEVRQPLPPVTAIVFDRARDLTVIAGTELRGNFRSEDGGLTWSRANTGLPQDHYGNIPGGVRFQHHPRDPRILYMASSSFSGIYRSEDGGQRWQPAGAGLPSAGVLTFEINANAPENLVAITDKGLARSSDGGANWQAVTSLPIVDPVDIEFEPGSRNTLYVAGARGTLLRSTNGGTSWVEVPSLPRPVRALTCWLSATGPMLGAAAGEGVWQLPLWPTMPASPEPVSPNRVYYPESGHHVAPVFVPFFRAWGGLERFGLPRTEEFVEDGVLVQYFERTRLELHPEHRGTPYEVQFSLLGEHLLGPNQLPPVEPFESSSDQRYFPETGHSVNYAFLRYFTSRGGLDSLGFPISEELQEAGRPVQYFQRARLEYRAEYSGTRDEVQLGAIGDEIIRRRGWFD